MSVTLYRTTSDSHSLIIQQGLLCAAQQTMNTRNHFWNVCCAAIIAYTSCYNGWQLVINDNRTEWSPIIIRSVIISQSDQQNWTTAKHEFYLLITTTITDRIGRHEVLLPINHKNYNFRGCRKGKKGKVTSW